MSVIAPGPFELVTVLLMMVLFFVVAVLPFWMISTKAGFPGWISLAILIPVLNLIFLFFLAFADWPALRRETSHGNHIET